VLDHWVTASAYTLIINGKLKTFSFHCHISDILSRKVPQLCGGNHNKSICQNRNDRAFFKEFPCTRLQESAEHTAQMNKGLFPNAVFSSILLQIPSQQFPSYCIWTSAKLVIWFSVFLCPDLDFFFFLKKVIYYQIWLALTTQHGVKFNMINLGAETHSRQCEWVISVIPGTGIHQYCHESANLLTSVFWQNSLGGSCSVVFWCEVMLAL
jgi:hypothetical protein